jgi:hypothetical protein
MTHKTKLGLGALAAALVLGVLADGLLKVLPWGINVPIWTMLLIATVAGLTRWQGLAMTGEGRWLVIPLLVFAVAIAWRDLLPLKLGIVLGMLNALFLAFVLVQFRYLFGGAPVIEASPDLTYAQYARRGFFELVAVAALVLPLLLTADWLLRASPGQRRAFRLLEATLILLLFVVMASAVQRMRLYTEEFGLTELRIYTTTFMGWLAIVFVWFLATVLRGRRERFTFGALVAAFAALAILNVANPDALIVRTNMQRAAAGLRFDAHYLRQLSADGIPTLVELLPTLPEQR